MSRTIIIGLVLLLVVASSGCVGESPTAKALAIPTSVNVGEIISFSGADSIDPDGTITSYEWDLGDGTTVSGATVTHAYSNEGTYTVKITVTDNDGLSDTDTVEVNVVSVLLGTIKIDVTSSTWREGRQPYDIYGAIKQKLEKAGFEVVPPESTAYDAILYVDYKEKKGSPYSISPVGPTVDYGTRIRCNLRLVDKTQGLIFEEEMGASTPYRTANLYGSAVLNFETEVYFKYVGEFIASKFGVGEEVSVLIRALEDRSVRTRAGAAEALGEIGDARAVEPLIQVLKDESRFVRESAAYALGEMGDAGAVELLILAFKGKYGFGSPQLKAKSALVKIGEPAVEPLIQALEDEEEYVRETAKRALEKIEAKKT